MDARGLRAALAERSSEVFVHLIEITHPQLAHPLRLTDNGQPIGSRGRLFTPVRARVAWPEAVEGRPARARLVLEDVTEDLRAEIRALSPHDAPRVTVELVLADLPDVTQRPWRNARLLSARWNAISVEGELAPPSALTRAAPWATFTPDIAPAVHRFVAGR